MLRSSLKVVARQKTGRHNGCACTRGPQIAASCCSSSSSLIGAHDGKSSILPGFSNTLACRSATTTPATHPAITGPVNGESHLSQRRLFSSWSSPSPSPFSLQNKKPSPLLAATTLCHHHHHVHPIRNPSTTNQQIRTKVFVSSHNDMNITSNQILDYCTNRGLTNIHLARVTSSHVILQECPFCTSPTNGKADNCYKCYVQIGGGAYFCHRCGNGGSWFDFKGQLRGYQHNVVSVNGTSTTATGAAASTAAAGSRRTNKGAATGKKRSTKAPPESTSSLAPGEVAPLPLPKQRLQACYNSSLLDSSKDKDHDHRALEYLQKTRGLKRKTLRKYGVGKAIYHFPSDQNGQYVATECITFPWIMTVADAKEQEELRGARFSYTKSSNASSSDSSEDSEVAAATAVDTNVSDDDFVTRRIKVRALDNKAWQRMDPAGGGWGLFGFHTIPDDATEIVLTEGEYDAMAVWQATGRPAISLPNGCRSLPMEVLPMLERFKKVFLWMDNDGPGQEGAKQFAQKIGKNRCYMVQPLDNQDNTCKDANEALLKGLDLEAMIQAAKVTKHENVMDFEALRSDVLHEILHPDKYMGVPMTSLPMLTDIIKGFRRGELSILTGPTGSGKTTFLGQLSLDLAEQDVNVMWGSFEIKNTRLIQKLLQQFSREPLPTGQPDAPAILHQLADRFSALPMYFMKFHGGSDLEDVLDAMEYAVYVSDVEHIILDNLQFMISRNTLNKSFDKFDIQDIAIEKFRKFATDRNVHVTLVVHPRKEDEASKLSISSIYGSAKATQEADTVMILQNDNAAGRQRKYLDIKKNRFDGTLGYCPLHFDRMSSRYDDTPKM